MPDHIKTSVTPDDIANAIVSVEYYVYPNTTVTTCLITLQNSTRVVGVNYGNIDLTLHSWEEGKKMAYNHAIMQIYPLENYLLREKLFGNKGDHRV